MSNDKTFVANSSKYPSLIGERFDLSKGVYILIKNGKVVAQGDNCIKIAENLDSHVTSKDDEFQLANLILVRADQYFRHLLHCVSSGYGLVTPPLELVYHDQNGDEQRVDRSFIVDTGSTISCVPQAMNPFSMMIGIDVETGAGVRRQNVTKIQVKIDERCYSILACITQASMCILGMDILRYYTVTIDGDRAGLLIKNSLIPQGNEEFNS